MEELCTGCLLPGRGLRFLNEEKTKTYLAQLPEDLRLELTSIKFSFCYCCSAMIHKIFQFQQLSTWAMHKLLAYHNTLSLGDLSDRPYFPRLDVASQLLVNVPSATFLKDLLDQTQTDAIKTENEIDISEHDIDIPGNHNDTIGNDNNTIENNNDTIENDNDTIENDACGTDYYCDSDSYINDVLVSKLNSFKKNDTESSEIVVATQEISGKKKKTLSTKNKVLKTKRKTTENIVKTSNKKYKKQTKTRKKTVTSDFDENPHSEPNKDIIFQNDKIRNENDVSKKKDNITDVAERKPEIKRIILSESQISEERKQMSYKSEYLLSHFKCKSCIMGFDTISDYDKHFAEYHDESVGGVVCSVCGRRFLSASALRCHARSHGARWRCERCGLLLASAALADEHAREHVRVRCALCAAPCSTWLHQQVHMHKAHGHKLQCTACHKDFSSAKTLRYHLKVLHKGQNQHPCPHCGKVYQWKSNLFRHIKNHKAQSTGELYCAPCDKSFSSVATHRQHLTTNKRHAQPQHYSFSCSECDKKFLIKRDLTDHVNWVHLHKAVHVCAHCDKPYKSYMALYLHQNVHKPPSERGKLCHLCGKCYPTHSKLKSHVVAKHSDTMPYRCTLCDAAFNWYSSLYRHAHKVHGLTKEQYKVNNEKKPVLDALPTPVG